MQTEKQAYDSNFKSFFQLNLQLQTKNGIYLKFCSTSKYNESRVNRK